VSSRCTKPASRNRLRVAMFWSVPNARRTVFSRAGDIAVYEAGPARPTGGCAAVAILVGRNAPLVLGSVRASHFEDAYDFYKPRLDSEYPTVFGKDSNQKWEAIPSNDKFNLSAAEHVVFHSPYNKLIKKSGARMLYNDWLRNSKLPIFKKSEDLLETFRHELPENTYDNRAMESAFVELAKTMYQSKVEPSTLLPMQLGNSYTASMYTGLASLIHAWHKPRTGAQVDTDKETMGKKILMFSYGSGLASTLFSMKVMGPTGHIAQAGNLDERLEERKFVTPEEFTATLLDREKKYGQFGWSPDSDKKELFPGTYLKWSPDSDKKELFPGTYYLKQVDEHGRRTYDRVALSPFRNTINYGQKAFHARMPTPSARSMHTAAPRVAAAAARSLVRCVRR
ncbi:hydroxymethylglutaryl-coenzyme A synthase C terminal-domain-containing protein, partial [Baffinella frigidus]